MAENYKQGSEGSRICDENIRKYPAVGALEEHAPAVTGKPYGATPGLESRKPASAEVIRRTNNQARDDKNSRWRVNQGYVSVDERSEPKGDKD
jgi:hypothetical protein